MASLSRATAAMPFGKLYSYTSNARSVGILAAAKANNLDLELVWTEPAKGVSEEYLRLNKLGVIPSFVGSDGLVLTESMAIAVYVASQNEETTLLGGSKAAYASILRWMSFSNTEVIPRLARWFVPLIGRAPYDAKVVEEGAKASAVPISMLEEHLSGKTWLVDEQLSLADLYVGGILSRGFQYVFDPEWREKNPNITRWYAELHKVPVYAAVAGDLVFIDKAIEPKPSGH